MTFYFQFENNTIFCLPKTSFQNCRRATGSFSFNLQCLTTPLNHTAAQLLADCVYLSHYQSLAACHLSSHARVPHIFTHIQVLTSVGQTEFNLLLLDGSGGAVDGGGLRQLSQCPSLPCLQPITDSYAGLNITECIQRSTITKELLSQLT